MLSVPRTLTAACGLAALVLAAAGRYAPPAQAQPAPHATRTLVDELAPLYRLDLLPRYRAHSVVAQVSSYDTTGGNNDGFSGRYSYLRREGDRRLVLADLQGPGVVHRIWTPTPTEDSLSFYFDGETVPRLRLRFIDLFSGDVFPFLKPVVGNEVGGYYSYVPIPYERSLKIVFEGERIMFHQIQYRRYPPGERIASFRADWSDAERAALEQARDAWRAAGRARPALAAPGAPAPQVQASDFTLAPGASVDLFRLDRGGRIVGIEVEPAGAFAGPLKDVLLQAYWDGEAQPAVQSPAADFFGFAFGVPSLQSLLLGSRDGVAYSYLPMPFDRSAVVRLAYAAREGAPAEAIRGKVRVYYTTDARDPAAEGRLYTTWRREIEPAVGAPYLLLEAAGRGHHAGTLLLAQGLTPGMTVFFEGDDVATVDGEVRLHGTGSEDAFNGGWYALADRWDRGISLPLHGSLDYSLPMARTGGFRFNLTDKVPFERSYRLTIEHGPEGNAVPVDYTSVAFYYGDTPPAAAMEPTPALRVNPAPTVHVYFPQLMQLNLGWNTTVAFPAYEDLVVSIDAPAEGADYLREGLLRLTLDGVPPGRYRLFLSYYRMPGGAPFSVWQRQRRVADWKPTHADAEQYLEKQPIGEVEVTDHIDTITIRTRNEAGRSAFKFNRVVLERVQE